MGSEQCAIRENIVLGASMASCCPITQVSPFRAEAFGSSSGLSELGDPGAQDEVWQQGTQQ